MKKTLALVTALGLISTSALVCATPKEDQERFQHYFETRFPKVPKNDFGNGVYAIDAVARENWEAIEEFPPYDPGISNGETMWKTPFANGKTYKDCFPDGPGIGAKYPHWDKKRSMVVTLPLAIPADDPKALAAYEKGKHIYFARRGQLNFSCASCHAGNSGNRLRTEILSPALGQTTHWPVYRSKWGDMGTLHRRFAGCFKQVRAKPYKAQGEEYRDLEYFLTYMNNGLPLNGPASRK
ncbi:MAG: sulfur oxidation c-type cytochrome SoxA [Chromatiaceae bacterium]